jgi:membrane-associated protein
MDKLVVFIKYLFGLTWISEHPLGLLFVIIIIFAETGLFVGFFLPGDSLLFVTGLLFAKDSLHVVGFVPMIIFLSIVGILGNMVGYWFGKKSGPLLFQKKDTLLFKRKHLLAAKEFYDERGPGTIFLARFLPIVRTFVPIVAGVVEMDYKKFMLYNIVGSITWITSMMCIGYFLGDRFPILQKRIDLLIIGIVLITTLPVLIKMFFSKKKKPTI